MNAKELMMKGKDKKNPKFNLPGLKAANQFSLEAVGIRLPLFIYRYISLSCFCIITCSVVAQTNFEMEFEKQYQDNILQEEINGVYIPKNIEDAIKELDRLSTPEGRKRLMEGEEETIKEILLFGLGKWMIVNWNFYEGSRLSHELRKMGISLPDDMAQFLIVTYYRHLKGLPLDLKGRADSIRKNRQKEQEERNKSKVVING